MIKKYYTQRFNGIGNSVHREIDGWLNTIDNGKMQIISYLTVANNIIITISRIEEDVNKTVV